jgi:hypothetical protein
MPCKHSRPAPTGCDRPLSACGLACRALALAACGAAALLLAGCYQGEEIKAYRAPRAEKKPLNRLLGAIVPHADKTWFFKLVGPEEAVKPQEAAFKQFVRSVHFPQKDAPIAWTVPQGWRQEAKENPNRYATFHIGGDDSPVELTVTELGREGEASSVPANVNRWRKQMGLRPLPDDAVAARTERLQLDGAEATLVDLTGPGAGQMVMPGAVAVERRQGPGPKLDQPRLTYKAPAGWTELPAGQFRVAAFEVSKAGQRAEVTVIPLPGQAGTLLDNVNRWRGQLKLPPIDEGQLRQDVKGLRVAGSAAAYVDLLGPEAAGGRQRTLAVAVPHGGATWFFKMTGPADLVAAERQTFEAFVTSVRFPDGLGN